jgi:hypothetical protein
LGRIGLTSKTPVFDVLQLRYKLNHAEQSGPVKPTPKYDFVEHALIDIGIFQFPVPVSLLCDTAQ